MGTEIASGIYWIDGGGSNFYLCADDDGLALIDCGMPRREQHVWDLLAELGRSPTDLTRILITHADIDHAGSVAALKARSGAKVYVGQESAALLPHGRSPQHLPWVIQFLSNQFFKYPSVPADTLQLFADGDELPVMDGLQVMATPGHTLGHFSFYHPVMGVLFAGDALTTRNGRLQTMPSLITADKEAARRSAIKLLELAPAVIACGHGAPSTDHSSNDLMALFNELRRES